MATCGLCGSATAASSRFCSKCGKSNSPICAVCGARSNTPGSTCLECGFKQPTLPNLRESNRQLFERRQSLLEQQNRTLNSQMATTCLTCSYQFRRPRHVDAYVCPNCNNPSAQITCPHCADQMFGHKTIHGSERDTAFYEFTCLSCSKKFNSIESWGNRFTGFIVSLGCFVCSNPIQMPLGTSKVQCTNPRLVRSGFGTRLVPCGANAVYVTCHNSACNSTFWAFYAAGTGELSCPSCQVKVSISHLM